MRQDKKIKGINIFEKEIKLFLFVNDMMINRKYQKTKQTKN